MLTFAIDPGPHTGIYCNKKGITLDLVAAEKDLGIGKHRYLWEWLTDHVPANARIICETFEFRKDDAASRAYIDYSTAEYVGVISLFCQLNRIEHIKQLASTGKGFWNNDKLKRAGMYNLCDSRHARDAVRHYLTWLTFTEGNQEYLYKLK